MGIASRVTTFRLQTAQRLLYSFGLPWTDMACLLLRRAGGLGDMGLWSPADLESLSTDGL